MRVFSRSFQPTGGQGPIIEHSPAICGRSLRAAYRSTEDSRHSWYQHLFQTERGRDCLTRYRQELCLSLWREWSPNWSFGEATFKKTARSFDNPDFVDVVIHCYRFHFGLAEGDPILDHLERTLAAKPRINVPAVTLDGLDDPLKPGGTAQHGKMFIDRHEHRAFQAGHNVPQEVPMAFADALLTVHGWTHRSELVSRTELCQCIPCSTRAITTHKRGLHLFFES